MPILDNTAKKEVKTEDTLSLSDTAGPIAEQTNQIFRDRQTLHRIKNDARMYTDLKLHENNPLELTKLTQKAGFDKVSDIISGKSKSGPLSIHLLAA